jgi:hypothetical protein
MTIFGFDTSDPMGLQNALKAAETNMEQMRSLIAESENRMEGIIATGLAQLDGATLTLKLTPIPKAEPVNP